MAPSQNHDLMENNQPGPHPSYIQIAKPYVFQHKVLECITSAGSTEAKDDAIRLQGVAWIDSVRKAMHLPVRTYNTAVVYYLKFRLVHPDNNGFIDAAAAALFAACKIEDTLKKSKEILCAAYNLKLTPAEQVTPDDALFENHSKTIIGLERLMLEASGFDFRSRYPQRLVLKIAKYYHVDKDTVGKTAYNMSLDLYRTFTPLKQTTPTLAMACVELSGRIFDQNIPELESGKNYKKWRITRPEVMETLLDLLDLYTHHRAATVVGQEHVLDTFIGIRIALNQEASANRYPRHTQNSKRKPFTNGIKAANGVRDSKEAAPRDGSRSRTSPRDDLSKELRSPQSAVSVNGASKQPGLRDGTVRFMLDPERARDEKHAVAEFFRIEEEEYEVEIERGSGERRRVFSQQSTPHLYAHSVPFDEMGVRGGGPVGGESVARADAGQLKEKGAEMMTGEDVERLLGEYSRNVRGVEAPGRREREPLGDQSVAFEASKAELFAHRFKKEKKKRSRRQDQQVPGGLG